MKVIQCEIKSPVLYTGKPTEDCLDAEHCGYVPSALSALQATLCMRLHDKTCPSIHAATQRVYTYCTHVTFKLFHITQNDISAQIQLLARKMNPPEMY